ncbi:MAG TPA: hypothetical protein VNO30_12465 [Kofleriaceae bacterium]|nr:hypothetical protein [Kofleriaceae bacterium]
MKVFSPRPCSSSVSSERAPAPDARAAPTELADAECRLREAEQRRARVAAAIVRMPQSEALLDQVATEEAAVRTARAEVAAAPPAARAPREAPPRAVVRVAFAAFVDELGVAASEGANAILRDAFGPGGIVVTPMRLARDCAGALRLAPRSPTRSLGGHLGAYGGSRSSRMSVRSSLRFRACAPICLAPLGLAGRCGD